MPTCSVHSWRRCRDAGVLRRFRGVPRFPRKNIEALLLLGTAFIILLGRTFVGVWLTGWIPPALSAFKIDELTLYVMQIFTTAGNRAPS